MSTLGNLQNELNNRATIPLSIESSLFIAYTHGKSHGMIEYLPDSSTFSPVVAFPEEFIYTPWGLKSCKYKVDCIIVISPRDHTGTVFDTKTREFKEVFKWQVKDRLQLTMCSSCFAIGNYLHVDYGEWNGDYSIYSIPDKTTRFVEVGVEQKQSIPAVIIKSNVLNQASSRILISGFARTRCPKSIPVVIVGVILKFHQFELFKFGGHGKRDKYVDSFYIGTMKNGDPSEPIEWRLAPQYRLKHPMAGFGCIQYRSLIITFGGYIQDSKGQHVTHNIYILDLRQNDGWIQSLVKCPKEVRGYYRVSAVVLDHAQRVHLNGRYCTNLKQILPQKYHDLM